MRTDALRLVTIVCATIGGSLFLVSRSSGGS